MKRASLLWFQAIALIVSLNLLSCGGGGGGGIPVETDDEAFTLAIQSDGKLVTAGFANNGTQNEYALVRYNANGTLDTTFGTRGIVTTAIGTVDDEAFTLAIDSTGNLIAAGFSFNSTTNAYEFALVRYNPNGTLDTTFGTGGIVTTAIGTFDDEANSLAIDSAGNLIAAGFSFNGTQNEFALVRYTTAGALDTTFNTTGIVTTAIGIVEDEAFTLAIDSTGKLIAAGYSNNGTQNEFALVRYTTAGALDTTFNTTGIVTTAIGTVDDEANSLKLDSTGNLIAAGFSFNSTNAYEFALVRYTTAGALDTTFNTTGIVTTAIGTVDDEAFTLAIDSAGNLIAAGYSNNGTQNEFALVRYTTAGALDTTFNTTGIVTTAIGTVDDEANSLAIDSTGNLVAAGFSFSHTLGQFEFALARYTTAGALDTTFNTTGIVTTAIHP